MLLNKYRYIVVEGPIGAGKTSLAQNMANYFNCMTLLEKPNENPFLDQFYNDIARYALPTQLTFLLQRTDQFKQLLETNALNKPLIGDFLLEKDQLFAKLTLSKREYAIYHKIYEHIQPQAPNPDLIIYLQASPEILIERIKRRNHAFEKAISEDYLWKLTNSYTQFFHQYKKAPVMIVNSDNLNFANNTRDFNLLLQQISQMRGATEYFSCSIIH